MGLTLRRIAKLVSAKTAGRYGDGSGLYLQVPPRGEKMPRKTRASWLLRYERNGRERWLGLGPLHTYNLNEARERARKARQQLQDGIDPLDARQAERAKAALDAARSLTFEEATRQYFNAHEKKWRNAKHRQQFLNTLAAYAFPKIGRLPVAAIDTGLILKCVEPIWQDKTETANRVRGRIEAVLDWATVRGYRSGDNPARWKGHLDNVLAAPSQLQKTTHHAALPFADLPDFLTAVRGRGGVGARALEFTILTAARTGEVIGAKWDEFDLDGKVWTVPSGRIKGGREHRVPLSERVVEILRGLPREDDNPFVFIGNKKGKHCGLLTMWQVLSRMKRADVTVHGFRSCFRDWAAERTNYPNHVVEMALAHAIGNKVEASYRRGDLFDKRRKLMEAWAKYCLTPPAKATGEVVSMHGRH
jgi:integrase